MVCKAVEITAPSLARVRDVSAMLAQLDVVRFDRTLLAARQQIGPKCDPSNPLHARRLRKWLNNWGCRIRNPRSGESDVFVHSIAGWWQRNGPTMPATTRTLSALSNAELMAIATGYADLVRRPVAVKVNGAISRLGPTATSKVLYFLRPDAVTAWDDRIAGHVGCDRSEAGFLAHLRKCRAWASEIEAEAAAVGIPRRDIGAALGRPDSSVAKLLDEYLYQVITRGWRTSTPGQQS